MDVESVEKALSHVISLDTAPDMKTNTGESTKKPKSLRTSDQDVPKTMKVFGFGMKPEQRHMAHIGTSTTLEKLCVPTLEIYWDELEVSAGVAPAITGLQPDALLLGHETE